jgi:Kef-type K+ transport system membrane component KefB
LGEIIAGIILGPSVLNVLRPNIVFEFIAEFGVILLLFEVGLETNLRTLMGVGRGVSLITLGDLLLPLAAGTLLGYALRLRNFEALYLGAVFTATSIGVSVRVLSDLDRMDAPESRAVLCIAICDDIVSMLLIAILFGLIERGSLNPLDIARIILASTAFILLTLFLGTRALPRLMEPLSRIPMRGTLLAFALFLGISTAYIATLIGLAPIIGAFIAGMLLAESREKEVIVDDLTPLSHVLTPVFFVLIGAAVDVKSIPHLLPLALLFTLVAIASKTLGCGSTSLLAGFRGSQALIIGLSMIPRGEVGLILARRGVDVGLISENLYALIVFMVLGTTLAAPLLLRFFVKHGRGIEEEGETH